MCPSGFFGLNCSFTSSNYCEGNGTCNHVTGICNDGCKEGLNGRLCGKGKLHSTNKHYIFLYPVGNAKAI